MARINIEDKWWSDFRRVRLNALLGPGTADGVFLLAIKASQDANGEAFNATKLFPKEWVDALIEAGLAEGEMSNLYICGSRDYHAWIKRKREDASKGGLAKASKCLAPASSSLAPAEQVLSNSLPSSSSSSSKRKKNTCAKSEIEPRFAEVWEAYPRKIAKSEALDRYKRLITSEEDHVKFTLSVKNYVAYCTANKTEEQYIKHMASFLGTENKQAWRDWIEYKSSEPPIQVYTFADLDRLFA